jgi:hypothetical protein
MLNASLGLIELKYTSPKLLRWCLQVQGVDFTIQHNPGKDNVAPDALECCVPIGRRNSFQCRQMELETWLTGVLTRLQAAVSD